MAINVLELLDRPIAYHVIFARITGSVTAAVFLSQAYYWQRRGKQDEGGWWWHTQKQWLIETGLSRREQESARKNLRYLEILTERKRGLPSKTEFRLNLPKLLEKIEQYQEIARNVHTRMAESDIQVCTNQPNKDGASVHTKETILKTITNNTTTNAPSLEIDEYLSLGVEFGSGGNAPHDPVGWQVKVSSRLESQGGLSDMDRSQSADWRKRKNTKQKYQAEIEQKRVEKEEFKNINPNDHRRGLDNIRKIRESLDQSEETITRTQLKYKSKTASREGTPCVNF